jgi:RimJ/RimL family protein N-acetyltransferase
MFTKCNLRKITLGVVSANVAAVELYEKCGFIKEGVYKNHGQYAGEYRDVIRMAKFNKAIKYE